MKQVNLLVRFNWITALAILVGCGGGGGGADTGAAPPRESPPTRSVAVEDRIEKATIASFDLWHRSMAHHVATNSLTVSVTEKDPLKPNTVAVIDLRSRTVRHSVPLPIDPNIVAVSADGQTIYVSDFQSPRVLVMHAADLSVMADLRFADWCGPLDGVAPLARSVFALVAHPTDSTLWALSCGGRSRIYQGQTPLATSGLDFDSRPDPRATALTFIPDRSELLGLKGSLPADVFTFRVNGADLAITRIVERETLHDWGLINAAIHDTGSYILTSRGSVLDRQTLQTLRFAGPLHWMGFEGGCAPVRRGGVVYSMCHDAPVLIGSQFIHGLSTYDLQTGAWVDYMTWRLLGNDEFDCQRCLLGRYSTPVDLGEEVIAIGVDPERVIIPLADGNVQMIDDIANKRLIFLDLTKS